MVVKDSLFGSNVWIILRNYEVGFYLYIR